MTKLNICYIVSNHTDEWFRLSVQSAKPLARRFVFVIDRPDQATWDVIEEIQASTPVVILHNRYAVEHKSADGLQREIYLAWLRQNADLEWALCIDTDEILDDKATDLLSLVQEREDTDAWDCRMRHTWWALGLEDATFPVHYVPKRLFKVDHALQYPLVEHPVLYGWKKQGQVHTTIFWHFSVTRGLLEELRKYRNQCKKSNMHNEKDLKTWHALHLCGTNPLTRYDLRELPKAVRDYFHINDAGEPMLSSEKLK